MLKRSVVTLFACLFVLGSCAQTPEQDQKNQATTDTGIPANACSFSETACTSIYYVCESGCKTGEHQSLIDKANGGSVAHQAFRMIMLNSLNKEISAARQSCQAPIGEHQKLFAISDADGSNISFFASSPYGKQSTCFAVLN